MRLSSPVYSFLRFAEFCGKDESVSDPSKEAGLFSAGTDADGRTRRCWGREHGCRGCDTLPDRQNAPLTAADFRNFAAHRAINAAEVLSCSRQNIVDLAKRWKLHPIKASEKSALYLGCRRFPAEYVREAKQWRFHEKRRFSKTGESECFFGIFRTPSLTPFQMDSDPLYYICHPDGCGRARYWRNPLCFAWSADTPA